MSIDLVHEFEALVRILDRNVFSMVRNRIDLGSETKQGTGHKSYEDLYAKIL